jgi:hypothetical protein
MIYQRLAVNNKAFSLPEKKTCGRLRAAQINLMGKQARDRDLPFALLGSW